MAKKHIQIPVEQEEVVCACKIVYNRHGWGCQCDEGCPTGPDGIEFCPLHKAAKDLLTSLKLLMEKGPDPNFDYDSLVNKAEGK